MALHFRDDISLQYKVTKQFGDLKQIRVEADYRNKQIGFEKSKNAFEDVQSLSAEIRKRLDI